MKDEILRSKLRLLTAQRKELEKKVAELLRQETAIQIRLDQLKYMRDYTQKPHPVAIPMPMKIRRPCRSDLYR